MKIKEYIEFKRQYFPPKVKVHNILDEGILAGTEATGPDVKPGDPPQPGGGGGNIRFSKKSIWLDNDEFDE